MLNRREVIAGVAGLAVAGTAQAAPTVEPKIETVSWVDYDNKPHTLVFTDSVCELSQEQIVEHTPLCGLHNATLIGRQFRLDMDIEYIEKTVMHFDQPARVVDVIIKSAKIILKD